MSNVLIKNFYGEIGGRNIYSFLADLDYTLNTSTERIAHLKQKLTDENGKTHPFFERLFEQTYDEKTKLNTSYIKLILNTTDGLYSETNVAEVLTKLTDYILFSPDEKAFAKENDVEYKFYNDIVLFNKALREISLEGEVEKMGASIDGEATIDDVVSKLQVEYQKGYNKYNPDDSKEVIPFLIMDKAFKKSTATTINKSDLEDEELAPILKPYYVQVIRMSEKLKENKDKVGLLEAVICSSEDEAGYDLTLDIAGVKDKNEALDVKIQLIRETKMLTKHVTSMKLDMLDIKEQIKRPIRFKHLMNGTTEADLSNVDFIPRQKGDIIPYLKCRAKDLEEYYSMELDKLEMLKTKGDKVITKIHRLNKLYMETQLIQGMNEDELYDRYIDEMIKMVLMLLLRPEQEYYDLQDDFEIEVFLIKEAVKYVKMDELDGIILKLAQQNLSQKDITTILNEEFSYLVGEGITNMSVHNRLNKIAERVMQHFENRMGEYLDGFRPAEKMKTCSKCGRTLSRDKFSKESKSPDGLRATCKECRNNN